MNGLTSTLGFDYMNGLTSTLGFDYKDYLSFLETNLL